MNASSEKLPITVKPHVERALILDIVYFYQDSLRKEGINFRKIAGVRLKPERAYWEEHYQNVIRKGYPEVFEKMVEDFDTCEDSGKGIDGLTTFIFYEGQSGLITASKEIAGLTFPKQFGKTRKTIREYFGNPEMDHRTFIHVPSPEEVEENFNLMRKYGILKVSKL